MIFNYDNFNKIKYLGKKETKLKYEFFQAEYLAEYPSQLLKSIC